MEKVDFPDQEKFPEDKEWEKWAVAQATKMEKEFNAIKNIGKGKKKGKQ